MTMRRPPSSFLFSLIVLSALALSVRAQDAATDARRVRSQEFAAGLDRSFDALHDALESLPRETFDVAACCASIGSDPESAFTWVRDQTCWIAYQGALRGAEGVLLDRMGSHLDRALLLAGLLEHSGHEVELARRTLGDDEALELAEIAFVGLPGPSDPVDEAGDRILEGVTRAAELFGVDPGQVAESVFEARAASDRMRETLNERGSLQSRALAEALGWSTEEEPTAAWPPDAESLASLADHWWVRVRSGDGWLDLDPSRRSHAPGDRFGEGEPSATYALDELPPESYHRLRIEVRAEQTTKAGRTQQVALSREVRAPDAVCQTLTLSWVPIGAPPVQARDESGAYSPRLLHESALAVPEWLPILMSPDGMAKEHSIRADGSINESPAMGFVGQGFARGMDALKGGEDPNAHLTAVFLRYEILAPGCATESIERPIFDLAGRAGHGDATPFEISEALRLQRGLALIGTTRTLLQPCWPSQEFALHRWLAGQLSNRTAILRAARAEGRGDTEGARGAMRMAQPSDASLLVLASQRRDQSPYANSIALTRLNLLGSYELLESTEQSTSLRRGIDILRNQVDVRPGGPHEARHVRLRQGVLDTVLEAELLDAEGPVENASRSFAATLARDAPVLPILDAAGLEALQDRLGADSRAQITEALESGFVAVLAEAPSDGAPVQWWRIDPRNGTCLGIGSEGKGQGAEFIGLLSVGLTVVGGLACIDSTDSEGMGCCMALWLVGIMGEAALALYLGGPVGAGVALAVAIFYSLWLANACD